MDVNGWWWRTGRSHRGLGTGASLAMAALTPKEGTEAHSAIQYLARPWELLYWITMDQDQPQEWDWASDKNRSQLMGPKVMSLAAGDPGIRVTRAQLLGNSQDFIPRTFQ